MNKSLRSSKQIMSKYQFMNKLKILTPEQAMTKP